MSSPSSSAVQALRALAARLREIRVEAGLSGRDLGSRVGWHSSKVSKIEYGRQAPTPKDIHAWCAACDLPELASELIASLHAAEGMFIEWRRMERAGLKAAQESVLPLWERTRWFRVYSGFLVPGPVQTADYITTVLESVHQRRGTADDIPEAVRVRVDKQQVIQDFNRRFAIILEESVIRARVGGPDVMAAQLGHLLVVSSLPSVSLGIIPLNADRSYTRTVEGFWIFDEERVTVELVSGHLTITQPREVGMYAETFADLAELAAYGPQARSLITAAISDLDLDRFGQDDNADQQPRLRP